MKQATTRSRPGLVWVETMIIASLVGLAKDGSQGAGSDEEEGD